MGFNDPQVEKLAEIAQKQPKIVWNPQKLYLGETAGPKSFQIGMEGHT